MAAMCGELAQLWRDQTDIVADLIVDELLGVGPAGANAGRGLSSPGPAGPDRGPTHRSAGAVGIDVQAWRHAGAALRSQGAG